MTTQIPQDAKPSSNAMAAPFVEPLRFEAAFEHTEKDEAETIAELKKVFVEMATTVANKEGQAHRAVHAKGQALLRGELRVLEDLPPAFAQGLFAESGRYETLIRFSSPPAEQLPDSISTPRAVALKVLGVSGERVPESAGDTTQDFLMVNGPVFPRSGPSAFLKDAKLLAATTEKAPGAKKLLPSALRGAEAVVEALGGESKKLKNMGGQPLTHPLAETYFSQAPFLYGPYMAKFSLVPVSPSLTALEEDKLDHGDDSQREAIRNFFSASGQAPAQWDVCVQLCTSIENMPIEDLSVEWDTALSPFVPVARLVVQAQSSWDERAEQLEKEIAFAPWHALAAHRPLGAVNRARREVMKASREFRSGFNRCPIHEPRESDHPSP
jgi:hypothetical protein